MRLQIKFTLIWSKLGIESKIKVKTWSILPQFTVRKPGKAIRNTHSNYLIFWLVLLLTIHTPSTLDVKSKLSIKIYIFFFSLSIFRVKFYICINKLHNNKKVFINDLCKLFRYIVIAITAYGCLIWTIIKARLNMNLCSCRIIIGS